MAYNNALPADNSKIRNGPQEIRDNFVAIEEADSSFKMDAANLLDRTSDGALSDDPTAIANTLVVYSKQDSGGTPQLYTINPSSAIQQLTGIGNIKAWANFNGSTGTVADSFNITSVTRNSIGNYTVAFTTNLASANYAVIVTGQGNSSFNVGAIPGVANLTVSGFNLYMRAVTGAFGADLNPVGFVVIGN